MFTPYYIQPLSNDPCQYILRSGSKIKISKEQKTSIYDIPYFITDNTKVKKAYNWAPKRNIKKIVSDIYVWLKKDKKKLTKYL